MSDTKALEEYLRLSLHSYEWGEMSLLQQAELRDQSAAELAQLNRDKDEYKYQRDLWKADSEKKELLINSLNAALNEVRKVIENYSDRTDLDDCFSADTFLKKYPEETK